jgi:putative oxidoreductase
MRLNIDLASLVLRLSLAAVMIYHGYPKVFGGIEGFATTLSSMGIPMPTVSAWISALTELLGGVAMLVGIGVRIASIPLAINMLVAAFVAHGGAFGLPDGMEYALTLALVSIAIGLLGPGRFALSQLLQRPA